MKKQKYQSDNIYRAASPRILDKFNSDPPNFCESSHLVTDEERGEALLNRLRMIEQIKEDLNNED
jgi:hypothetical protein